MRDFGSSEFLDLWERGHGLHAIDKGLLMLGADARGVSYDTLADWPLGRRNRALLELRCLCFGPQMQARTACARCGEQMEFTVDGRMIANSTTEEAAASPIAVNGRQYRLPTSRDLARAARETDPLNGAIRIVEACRIEDAGNQAEWTEEELEEIGDRMALADPLAEIAMDLTCPECGHRSTEPLDIVDFLWSEIEARAKRLLWEVHALASAYGWTEREVLSLSSQRRGLYLAMVQG